MARVPNTTSSKHRSKLAIQRQEEEEQARRFLEDFDRQIAEMDRGEAERAKDRDK